MIEVVVTNPATGVELARIEIQHVEGHDDETADYTIKYAVDRGTAVGVHRRLIQHFPRKRYNVLALLTQALSTLEPKELELERGFDPDERQAEKARPSDLARRIGGTRYPVQGWED